METAETRSARGRAARRRGASSERELCKLLSERLGMPVERTVRRYKGDADATPIGIWLLEIKRQERLHLTAWWDQTVGQAERVNKLPLLAYRRNREAWKFRVALRHLAVEYCHQPVGMVVDMGLDEALLVIREGLLPAEGD